MALREIVNIPDPVLRRKAHKVTEVDKEFQTVVDDMIETMRAAPRGWPGSSAGRSIDPSDCGGVR